MMRERIAEHKRKIKEAEKDYREATGLRKKDLGRHVKRLKKELAECQTYLKQAI